MPWQLFPLLLLLLTACADLRRLLSPPQGAQGSRSGVVGPKERPASGPSQLQQQKIARDRCFRELPALEVQMAELRRSEARLAKVKEEAYVPQSSPPRWNEDEESRFRIEDREADWQRYLQAREDWTRGESGHRARWQADHANRWQEAQARLDQVARSLRDQQPDLFTAPGSIEFNPVAVRRLRDCGG
jgi:hypothetical protein